jgi:hypothetical protein
MFYCIRGNHDDPSLFDGSIAHSNIVLLEDYSQMLFGDKKIQLVGGAVSIDRIHRKPGTSYWSKEPFLYEPDKAVECDILITHTAPSWIGPTVKDNHRIQYWLDNDDCLYEDLSFERQELDKLIRKCKPTRHFCGHFHLHAVAEQDGCISRILDIDELLELV